MDRNEVVFDAPQAAEETTVTSDATSTESPVPSTLFEALRQENRSIRLELMKHGWAVKLRALLERAVARGEGRRKVFASTDGNKREHAEEVADKYLSSCSKATHKTRESVFNILEEVLANAARDGNKLDPAKFVTVVDLIVKNAQAHYFGVYVADEGNGFILDQVANPAVRRQLADKAGEGGMGLEIINGRLGSPKIDGNAHYLPMEEGNPRTREVFIKIPIQPRPKP